MWQAVVIGASAAMSIYGQYKANQAQADAEEQNAAFLREQAKFFQRAGDREERIHEQQSKHLFGEQVGAYARGGVDIGSGSALAVLAGSKANAMEEAGAIRSETELRTRLALLRAQQADETAAQLRDPMNNFLQGAGTALGASGNIAALSSRSSSTTKTTNTTTSKTASQSSSSSMGPGAGRHRTLGSVPTEY